MLAAHRAAELDDQVGDLARDRPERLDPFGRLDVDDRPDVQAADVGVAVAGGLDAVALRRSRGTGRRTRAAGRGRRPCPRRRRSAWRRRPSPSGARSRPCGPSRSRPWRRSSGSCGRPSTPRPALEPPGQVVGPRRPARPASRRRTGRPGRRPGGPRRSRGGASRAGSPPARSRIIRSSISTATGPVATISARRSSAAGIVANERTTSPCAGGSGTTFSSAAGDDGQRPLRADDQLRQVELPGLVAPSRRAGPAGRG